MEKTHENLPVWWHDGWQITSVCFECEIMFGQPLFLVEIQDILHCPGSFSKNLERFISQLRSFMKCHAWYLTRSLHVFGARWPKFVHWNKPYHLNTKNTQLQLCQLKEYISFDLNPCPNMKDIDLWSSLFQHLMPWNSENYWEQFLCGSCFGAVCWVLHFSNTYCCWVCSYYQYGTGNTLISWSVLGWCTVR